MRSKVVEIILTATILALVMTIPPILGIFLLREARATSPLLVIAWLVGTLVWMSLVLYLFIKRRG